MPLGDDQKAMLRLLAREQSYEDIAALMGLSVDEVVTRARGAVEQLEAEGIPAPALPDAPGGADAPPPAPKPPAPEPEPPAPPPEKPAEPVAPAAAAPPPPTAPPRAAASKPRRQRDPNMLLAIGGGVVAVIVIVVLAVLLISNSDGDGDSSAASGDSSTVAANGSASRQATVAELEAVDGGDASGSAEFGRVKDSLALGIKVENLDQLPKDQIYMVWLAESPRKMLPLTAVLPNKAGRINASYQVPTEAVVYLASGDFDRLVVTRVVNDRLRASLERANRDKEFPTYSGDPVLEGQISGPILGAAERLEQRQK